MVVERGETVGVSVQLSDDANGDGETIAAAEVEMLELDGPEGAMSRPLMVWAEAEEPLVAEVTTVMVEEELMTAVVTWAEVANEEEFVE